MEKESLDQCRSVHLVLYSTKRQNSTVRKLSRLPAFPPSRGKAPRRHYQYFTCVHRRLGF